MHYKEYVFCSLRWKRKCLLIMIILNLAMRELN